MCVHRELYSRQNLQAHRPVVKPGASSPDSDIYRTMQARTSVFFCYRESVYGYAEKVGRVWDLYLENLENLYLENLYLKNTRVVIIRTTSRILSIDISKSIYP